MEVTMQDEPMDREGKDISTPEGKSEPQGPSRRFVIVSGLLALAILLVLVLWVVPNVLTRLPTKDLTAADRLKAENDVRTALVATIVAFGALAGLVFTA